MKKKLTTLGISTVLAVTSIAFTAPAGHAVNDESEIDSFIQSIFHPPAWKGPAGNLGAFGAGSSWRRPRRSRKAPRSAYEFLNI